MTMLASAPRAVHPSGDRGAPAYAAGIYINEGLFQRRMMMVGWRNRQRHAERTGNPQILCAARLHTAVCHPETPPAKLTVKVPGQYGSCMVLRLGTDPRSSNSA